MATTKMVSIPIEEYKALLLKETPTDKDRMIVDGVMQVFADFCKIVDKDSYSSDFKGLEFKNENKMLVEIATLVYMLDRDRFVDMYKDIISGERAKTVQSLNVEYMNKHKEAEKLRKAQ